MSRRATLRDLLQAYTPSDSMEEAHKAAMLTLLDVEGDPFGRGHFVPGHFTASSFVLSPDGGSLLLIYHGKLHRWLQPGGHVDPEDEDIFQAAKREVAEETGKADLTPVGGIFDLDVHVIPARKADPAHSHFDVRVLFKSESLDFQAGSDAKDARWVKLGDISQVESDASVMRAVGKLLK